MTKRMSDEELMDARDRARCKADNKAYDILVRRDRELDQTRADLEPLIGELNSTTGGKFYINVRLKNGRMTGAIKRFRSRATAMEFLIRNNYILRV